MAEEIDARLWEAAPNQNKSEVETDDSEFSDEISSIDIMSEGNTFCLF